MAKRTHASVTEELCTCGYLRNAANDPRNPIKFDAQTSEYQFVYGDEMLVIYHCPFCGGAAPESQRDLLFAQVSTAEEERLAGISEGVETIDDAIKRFGRPDFEGVCTTRSPEQEDQAPWIQHHREIRCHNLSVTAQVWVPYYGLTAARSMVTLFCLAL